MLSWLFKKKAVQPGWVERVWIDCAARERALVRQAAAGPAIFLGFFDEAVERLEAALTAAGLREAPGVVVQRVDQLTTLKPGAPVVLIEGHPLQGNLEAAVGRVHALAPTLEVVCHSALDDALMRRFGGERTQGLMRQLGMTEDEALEHPHITQALAGARASVAKRLVPAVGSPRSADEWLRMNLPGGN
jgi:hypothetical protein